MKPGHRILRLFATALVVAGVLGPQAGRRVHAADPVINVTYGSLPARWKDCSSSPSIHPKGIPGTTLETCFIGRADIPMPTPSPATTPTDAGPAGLGLGPLAAMGDAIGEAIAALVGLVVVQVGTGSLDIGEFQAAAAGNASGAALQWQAMALGPYKAERGISVAEQFVVVAYWVDLPGNTKGALSFGMFGGSMLGAAGQQEIAAFDRWAQTVRFFDEVLPECTARINLPSGLKPGDTLSLSAAVASADSRPINGPVQMVWSINGQEGSSAVWDGQAAAIGLQLSCQGHAYQLSASVPAYVAPTATPLPKPGAPLAPIGQQPLGGAQPPTKPGAPTGPLNTPADGLTGVNNVPGPANLGEALIGLLIPAGVGAIGSVIATIASGVSAIGGALSPEGGTTSGEGDKEGGEKPEKAEKAEKECEPAKHGGLDADSLRIGKAIDRLREMSKSNSDPRLGDLIDKISKEAFNPDGTLNKDKWAELNPALKQAITWSSQGKNAADNPSAWTEAKGLLGEFWKDPLGSAKDAGKATAEAGADAAKQAYGVVEGALKNVGYFTRGAAEILGTKSVSAEQALGGLLANPGDTLRGWSDSAKQWGQDKLKGLEPVVKEFGAALRDGKLTEALGNALTKLGAGAWNLVKEMGGLEEIHSIFSGSASLQEKLWAIPSLATKIGGLLAGTETGMTRVPGMGTGSFIPSVNAAASTKALEWANQVSKTAEEAKAAGKSAWEVAQKQVQSNVANTAAKVEGMVEGGAVSGAKNLKQMQNMLDKNPALTTAVDDIIKSGGSHVGKTAEEMRRAGAMSEETYNLITARKLQVQEQVINNVNKRIYQEELAQKLANGEIKAGEHGSFHTFQGTQGNREFFGGSNPGSDLDHTVMGTKYVSRERMEQIAQQEAQKAGFSGTNDITVNIYKPETGVVDLGGKGANQKQVLENIGQTTGRGQRTTWTVTKDGEAVVGESLPQQGRESIMAGRQQELEAHLANPNTVPNPVPKGMTKEEWVWQGHQGRPVSVTEGLTTPQQQTIINDQLKGLGHAETMSEAVKYANRVRQYGGKLPPELSQALRQAGRTDPVKAQQILGAAGIHTKEDLQRLLGL